MYGCNVLCGSHYIRKKNISKNNLTNYILLYDSCNTLFLFLDFQKFVFTSLTHFKYDISAMMHIVKDTNEKIQALISKSNENNYVSTANPKLSCLDMNTFPITTEDQLMDIEKKIDDIHFKNELVKLILLLLFIYIIYPLLLWLTCIFTY